MEYLQVKNWEEYQHYQNRNPPWIKLHTKLLNDRTFTLLSCSSRGLLMQLWILASENKGKVVNDLAELKFRLRDESIKEKDLNLLIEKGFLVGCKHLLASASTCSPSVSVSVSSLSSSFKAFWDAYPKKVGKGAAIIAWKKIRSEKETLALILKALEWQKNTDQWTKERGQFIPNPATYLNQQRWEDEPDGNTDHGRRHDNVFLRTVRENEERVNGGRMGGRSESLQGCRGSEGGTQGDGGMPEDADPAGCDPEDDDQ